MLDFENLQNYRENNRIEAKEALGGLPESIWETYSAFANTLGGVILLGVEELPDKRLHALDLLDPEWLIDDLKEILLHGDIASTNLLTDEHIRVLEVEGKHIIAVTVPPAPAALRPVYVRCDGRWECYCRCGEGDYRCTEEEIAAMVAASGKSGIYGAILGDIIGSPYEFDMGDKTKDFPLFREDSQFTDDTVMTLAVAEAFLDMDFAEDDDVTRDRLVYCLRNWADRYPDAGYGARFLTWLHQVIPTPYNSWGNGSAMRVAPVGWLFDDLEMTRAMARLSAAVTHNHPEGIKGADATASILFLARTGSTKEQIRQFVTREFGYDLSRSCDEIRPGYRHVESCQETVPEAITAFLEGSSFEDVIRTAVSLGGDCDTLTCIAGAMAGAFYGVPEELIFACRSRIPGDMRLVLDRLHSRLNK